MILFSCFFHRRKQIQVGIPGLGAAPKEFNIEIVTKLLQIQLVCNVVCSPKLILSGMSSRTLLAFWSTLFSRNPVKSQLISCQLADMPFVLRHSLSLRMVIWCKHIVVHIICFVICVLVQTLLSRQFPRILNSQNKALDWYKLLIDIFQMLLRDNSQRKEISRIFLPPKSCHAAHLMR